MSDIDDDEEMLEEIDFSNAERGKHYNPNRTSRTVRIIMDDGTVEVHHYEAMPGMVALDPDVREHFPDGAAVNNALRSVVRKAS